MKNKDIILSQLECLLDEISDESYNAGFNDGFGIGHQFGKANVMAKTTVYCIPSFGPNCFVRVLERE